MSETAACRETLAPFAVGLGMDVGAGGDRIVPSAWAFDLPQPYTAVAQEPQQLRGDCRYVPFICDNALDYIYASHVLEDFTYRELIPILQEWWRVLAPGGRLIINCPDQQRFLAWCEKTGQGTNDAHKEPDFSLVTFRVVVGIAGGWREVFVLPDDNRYSWYLVLEKVDLP